MEVWCILCFVACITFANGILNDDKTIDIYDIYLEEEACECGEGSTGCTFKNGEKSCTCKDKYAQNGTECQECDCGVEGTCKFRNDGRKKCVCNPGFIPINGICENPCASNLCENDGVCILNGTDFMCECKGPYFGKLCQFHPCLHSYPCDNGGACIAVENDYGCVCKEPFHGKHCEIDPCSSGPCMNEGVCAVAGIDFKCTCKTPYSGRQCELDPCSSNPCKYNGICYTDYDKYYCHCKMPFFGPTCEKIVSTQSPRSTETESATIFNEVNVTLTEINRTEFSTTEQVTITDNCDCGINSINCYIYRGRKLCKCKENYVQRKGTCTKTCYTNSDCFNGGKCKNQGGSYFCDCPDDYFGDMCEVDVCWDRRYECASSGAVCKRVGDTGVCVCPEGKQFSLQTKNCVDVCSYDTCDHGFCIVTAGKYKCRCDKGFTGRRCDEKITQATDAVPFSVLILIVSIGIVIFAVAGIVAICWVKSQQKLLEKIIFEKTIST